MVGELGGEGVVHGGEGPHAVRGISVEDRADGRRVHDGGDAATTAAKSIVDDANPGGGAAAAAPFSSERRLRPRLPFELLV